MTKTYLATDLFQDIEGDPDHVLFNIPPEICQSQGWVEGDTISIVVEDGKLIMKKIVKQEDNESNEYDAFVARLEAAYPKMFSEPYGGVGVDSGWWPIIETLCANIQSYINWKNKESEVVPQVVVAQIKEKFGGLRFYYDGGDDKIRGMVTMAEAWADHHCETCGAPGKTRHGGWIKTFCDTHHALRESRKQSGV